MARVVPTGEDDERPASNPPLVEVGWVGPHRFQEDKHEGWGHQEFHFWREQ